MEIWSIYPANAMQKDAAMGGYSTNITFRDAFKETPQILVTTDYPNGITSAGTAYRTMSGFKLYCLNNLQWLNVTWIAIGVWK